MATGVWRRVRSGALSLVLPGRIEIVLAVGLASMIVVVEPLSGRLPWEGIALDLVAALFAAIAGIRPRVGGWLTALFLLTQAVLPGNYGAIGEYTFLIVLLGVGMRGEFALRRRLAVVYLVLLFPATWQDASHSPSFVWAYPLWIGLTGIVWMIGNAFHAVDEANRRAHLADLVLQRQVLARELHDTVARSFTNVAMVAERARLRGDASPSDLNAISDAADKGLSELRWMLSLLRDPSASVEALSSGTSLAEALAAAEKDLTEDGFTTTVSVEGDLSQLSAEASETLAAVTAEAAANITRHGDRSQPAGIVVQVDDGAAELAFINATAEEPRSSADPLGLWGLRQRVESVHGEVDAGAEEQQWVTRVRLPLQSEEASES